MLNLDAAGPAGGVDHVALCGLAIGAVRLSLAGRPAHVIEDACLEIGQEQGVARTLGGERLRRRGRMVALLFRNLINFPVSEAGRIARSSMRRLIAR